MALGNTEQTGKILLHHWQAFGAGDVEAIMTDYADDAVLITPEGTLKDRRRYVRCSQRFLRACFQPARLRLI